MIALWENTVGWGIGKIHFNCREIKFMLAYRGRVDENGRCSIGAAAEQKR